jgi:hypothetical protein
VSRTIGATIVVRASLRGSFSLGSYLVATIIAVVDYMLAVAWKIPF